MSRSSLIARRDQIESNFIVVNTALFYFQAREKTGADASVIYVPPAGAAKAILEAIDAEV